MTSNNTSLQKTLARSAQCRGTGVHTGIDAVLEIKPAPADRGIVFIRNDLPGSLEIPARVEVVGQTNRGTSLGEGDRGVKTVEHLLAVLSGLEIDNAVVEMNGPELPMGDGSGQPFLEMVQSAGIRELSTPRRFIKLSRPVSVESPLGIIVALPAAQFRIACTIAFEDPLLDAQFQDLTITPEVFSTQLAPARTFGFYREALPLLKQGLIRGTSLDNTVIIGPGAIFSRGGLRFKDECVRHKMLDLIGDLALLGLPLKATVIAIKPGHQINIELVKKIKETCNEPEKLP